MPVFGRYARLVRGLLGLEASQVGVLPELLPTIEMQAADGSTAWLRGENLYGFFTLQGAIAGQYAQVVLRNPADSGHLVVIEQIDCFNDSGARRFDLNMERGGTAGANAVTVGARDARVWSDVPPYPIPCQLEVSRGGVVAAAGTCIGAIQTTAAWAVGTWVLPIVILPGTALYIMEQTLNVLMGCSCQFFTRRVDGVEYG